MTKFLCVQRFCGMSFKNDFVINKGEIIEAEKLIDHVACKCDDGAFIIPPTIFETHFKDDVPIYSYSVMARIEDYINSIGISDNQLIALFESLKKSINLDVYGR